MNIYEESSEKLLSALLIRRFLDFFRNLMKNLDTRYNKMLKKSIKSMRIEEFRNFKIRNS